jgi:hypothetical protein
MDKHFGWWSKAKIVIQYLKISFMTISLLIHVDFSKPFIK